MRMRFRYQAAIGLLLVLAGCATTHAPAEGATFVLVRHAEKAADDPRDPSLSAAGMQRARRMATRLHGEPVVAVYATAFRRTQQTAAPTASDHRLAITTYDTATGAEAFASDLRDRYRRGTVLVVGHSNTVPALAHALCGCAIAPTLETEYGRRIVVRLLPGGGATVDDRGEP